MANMINTIADTIIWLAEERQLNPETRCQNLNSQIHALQLDIAQLLMDRMIKEGKGKKHHGVSQ